MVFAKLVNNSSITHCKESWFFQAGAVFSVLLMLTIPFSTTVSITLTFLIIGCWILSSQYRTLPTILCENPVALAALLLYGLLLVGTLYSDATIEASSLMLRKYRELLVLLVLLPFMQKEKYRRWTINAFVAASVVTLLGSYLKDLGVLPMHRVGTATFKSHITHSLFMAFFAYFCAYQTAKPATRHWIWLGLCLLTTFNLFFIVHGRTGQVIFFLLMLLFFFQRFSTKHALILAPLLLLCIVGALGLSGKVNRFQEAIVNSSNYLLGQQNLDTSMGQRLYFWQNSIRLIREHPITGYGTGSFAAEFIRITKGKGLHTHNPHNEYLMISVQLGAIGLVAYLWFLACQWRHSIDLPEDQRWFAQGVVLSLSVNSLLNSTFLDHTEGHWYASLIALSFATLSRNHRHRTPAKVWLETSK